jgi:hypothetical protein
MLGRYAALVSAVVWLTLATILIFVASIILGVNHIPCLFNSPLCLAFNHFLLYDVLFGQVNITSVQTLIGLLPFWLLILSSLMLFCAMRQLRYAESGAPLGSISFSLGFHSMFLIILLLFNLTFGSAVDYWRVQGNALNGRTLDTVEQERLAAYSTAATNAHLVSLGLSLVLVLLTGMLFSGKVLNPPTPARALRKLYLENPNQCIRCGLLNSTTGRPTCPLCLTFISLEIQAPSLLIPKVSNVLVLQIKPGHALAREPQIRLTFPQVLKIEPSGDLPSGWKRDRDTHSSVICLTGPSYFDTPQTLVFGIIAGAENQRQWRRVVSYMVWVTVSDRSGTGEPVEELCSIKVQREANVLERSFNLSKMAFQRWRARNRGSAL